MNRNNGLFTLAVVLLAITLVLAACSQSQQTPLFKPIPGAGSYDKIAVTLTDLFVVSPANGIYKEISANADCMYSKPSWNRDGVHLILTEHCGGLGGKDWHLVIYDEINGQVHTFLPNSSNAAWSPDGKHIAYDATDADGISHIYVVDVDENAKQVGNPKQITSGYILSHEPSWTPDGKVLFAGSNDRTGTLGIFMVDPDSLAVTEMIAIPNMQLSGPKMSINGILAFTARPKTDYSDNITDSLRSEVRVTFGNYPTSQSVALIKTTSNTDYPSWSPDGASLLYFDDGANAGLHVKPDVMKDQGFFWFSYGTNADWWSPPKK